MEGIGCALLQVSVLSLTYLLLHISTNMKCPLMRGTTIIEAIKTSGYLFKRPALLKIPLSDFSYF